jgi:hypothetical protein
MQPEGSSGLWDPSLCFHRAPVQILVTGQSSAERQATT